MAIHHIVLVKYKPEATTEQRQIWKDAVKALPSQIPAIQDLIVGEALYSQLGHGFDDGVIFVFENVARLDEYRPHKAHTDYQALTAPYVEDKLIFDIETA